MDTAERPASRGGTLTRAEFRAGLEALIPTFRERALATEEARRLSEDSMALLQDAGVFRVLQPKRFGGFEFDISEGIRTNMTLARGCGSTAWSACQGTFHNFLVALYPLEAQQEVWEDPSAVLASGFMPTGKAAKADGGYLLSGAWPYASNCDNSSWFLAGALVPPAKDGEPPAPGLFLISRKDVRIEDTWFNAGMAGSGSKTFVADEPIFVPAYRVLTMPQINSTEAPGTKLSDNPMYRMRFSHVAPSYLASVAVGIALTAIDEFCAVARTKMAFRMGAPPIPMAEQPHVQRALGEASAAAEAAQLILLSDITDVETRLAQGLMPEVESRVRMRRNQAYAGRLAAQAVNQIMEVSGASSTALSSPVQRAWRDVHTVVSHISLTWGTVSAMYGQQRLGQTPVGTY